MQTVVLAAGEGTRMRPLTDTRPKPLLPVADRPLLAHTLSAAAEAGASRFVVVVGYRHEQVRSALGHEYAGVPIQYAHQAERRGTAHALEVATPSLDREPFVVLNGDTLYDPDSLAGIYEGRPAVGAVRVEDPSSYGVLVSDDGETVAGVIEKPDDPSSDLVNAGAYAFPPAALSWTDVPESERGELELTDLLTRTCRATDVRAVGFDRWFDVGRPWELLAANEWKLAELADGPTIQGDVDPDASVSGGVVVEGGAEIRAGAVVEGPALVREGASVGPNAYVRGATLLGPGTHVGHAVEVKNSVLMAEASVGHLSYVGDSVLGREVNFGAGTVTANLRHDERPVEHAVNGRRVSTGRRKFGVVAGDGAKTGINTGLDAGVTLSTDARTGVGEAVLRDR